MDHLSTTDGSPDNLEVAPAFLTGTTADPAARPAARQKPERHPWSQLRLELSERRALLAVTDVAVVTTALWLSTRLDARTETIHPSWVVVLTAVWFSIGILLNIYDLAKAASPMHSLWSAGATALLTTLVYLLIPYLTPPLPERRLRLLLFPALATSGVAAWRLAYAKVFVQPVFQRTALVIGAGWSGRTLAQAIAESGNGNGNPYRGTGYRILGFIDDDPAKQDQEIEGIPVLGTRHDLLHWVQVLRPDEVIVAITHSQLIHAELFQAILDVRELGIPLSTMTSLYERITGRVPVEHAGRDLHVVFPMTHSAGYRLYLALRRLFDIVAALLGCLSLICLIPIVWLVNRITDPGDVFYWQERVGKGGRRFRLVKFRSMVMDAEKSTGAIWATEDDPRVTPMGKFLRKTRLDEVPQFWNVLKGEMSVIGPRPERPQFVAQLARQIPFYRARHAVKPGITGWAQVSYRYGASVEDALIKLQYDLYYIKHMGPFLDLLILLKTAQVILGMKGR